MYKRVNRPEGSGKERKGRGWERREVGARTGEDKQTEGKEDCRGAFISVVTYSTQTQGHLGVEFWVLFMHISSAHSQPGKHACAQVSVVSFDSCFQCIWAVGFFGKDAHLLQVPGFHPAVSDL